MKIARVFPRRTNATPVDELVYIGDPPIILPEVDEVHISCTFTWDIKESRRIYKAWVDTDHFAKFSIGGPAFGSQYEDFTPGMYLKKGYVITSRGCNNNCWYCDVNKREGPLKEIPITEGWNLLDNNILQCSEEHIRAVFAMLKKQPKRAHLTGGMEARLLKDWHVELLAILKPKQIFFAYDKPEDYEPLVAAAEKLFTAGFTAQSHTLRCYVLVGYPGDRLADAENRLLDTKAAGFTPMAMLYRDETIPPDEWKRFQRKWARPGIVYSKRGR